MKGKKGLTLIEIVVAIAILGIISVMLYPALTGQYSLLRKTRVMTEDLFGAQRSIEVEINDVKTAIQNGDTITLDRSYYDIFDGTAYERTVGGYARQINVHVDNSVINLNAVIADSQLSAFPTSSIDSATIWMADDFNDLDFAYWNTSDLRVLSDYTEPNPADINMYNICRWYVSREGFNSPPITNPLEIELGTIYPRFPDDYSVISNYLLSDLNSVQEAYAGRHIIFSVTPVSNQYKMGKTIVSNSVFVSGLPYTQGLTLHLDASMIDLEDSSSVRESSDRFYVNRWRDLSGQENDAIQTNTGYQPELISTKIADINLDGFIFETHARLLRFNGSQIMAVANDNSLDLSNMTLLVVAKSAQTTPNDTIVSKLGSVYGGIRGWFYGWDSTGNLSYYIRRDPGINVVTTGAGIGLDNEWHIMTASASTENNLVTLQMDSSTPIETTRTISNSIDNYSPLLIGGSSYSDLSTIDVAEIILYDRVLASEDLYEVYTYLENKYNPTPAEISIYSLKPFVDSVIIGQPYSLPSALTAYMSDGSARLVSVTWSPTSTVDTSTPGTKSFVATAVSNPSKSTTGQITVAGLVSMYDDSATVEYNEAFSLPAQETALLTDGSTLLVDVDWYQSDGLTPAATTVDTSTIGTKVFIGKASIDPSRQMTMTVQVVPTTVTGVTLNITEQTLSVGSTLQLIATVEPDGAYNKTVTWTSSNSSVAAVTSGGLVQAVGGGTATITATTEDGGYTATCSILVNTPVTGVSLDVSEKTLRRGTSFQLIETVLPAGASNKNVTWTTSNDSAATVSDNGVVIANRSWRAEGRTTVITVTTEDGGYTDTCLVTIGNPVTGITVTPSSATLMTGSSQNLNASLTPYDASNTNVTWTSSNPSVATVNSSGQVNGVSAGTATITAITEDGGFTDTCDITVVWRAISISGDDNNFNLTFSTSMQAGQLDGSSCNVVGSELRFAKNSGSYNEGNYNILATAANGDSRVVTVHLDISGWWFWTTYTWSIVNP